MGLDMYLTRKIYVGGNYEHNNVTGIIDIRKGRDSEPIKIDLKKVRYIEESAGYWRKANQIHKWFVENVQEGVDNCGTYHVSKGKLKELLAICKEIQEKCKLKNDKIKNGQRATATGWEDIIEDGKLMTNSHLAAKLLPSASGFFFGSTDYDQYYLDDINNTVEIIEALFKDGEIKDEIYYHSSW